MPRVSRPLTQFYDKIKFNEYNWCWEWLGERNRTGYGRINIKGKHSAAHRFSYMLFKGHIKEGLEIDHLCRNHACCNPEHVEAVTRSVNLSRGHNHNRDKTHCPNGHPYSGKNLEIRNTGRRRCKKCKRAQIKQWEEKNKEKIILYHKEYRKNH